MTIRGIYTRKSRTMILLRGVIGVCVGLLIAAIWSFTTDTNAFRRFAFPIFGVPVILTLINLLIFYREPNQRDDKPDA